MRVTKREGRKGKRIRGRKEGVGKEEWEGKEGIKKDKENTQ